MAERHNPDCPVGYAVSVNRAGLSGEFIVEVNLSLVFDNSDAAERAITRLGKRDGQLADMGAAGSTVHELVDDLCGMDYSHIVKDGKIRAKDRGKVVP